MLTPAERKEKKTRKLVGAAAEGEACPVTCYRIASLANTQHRFKVRVNAVVRWPARCVLARWHHLCSFRSARCAALWPFGARLAGSCGPAMAGVMHLAGSCRGSRVRDGRVPHIMASLGAAAAPPMPCSMLRRGRGRAHCKH